jgi:hypothetical protein
LGGRRVEWGEWKCLRTSIGELVMSKRLFSSKKKLIVNLLAVVVIGGFLFLIWKSLTGKTDKGVVKNVADLPYVGEYLKDLKVAGEVKYASWRQYNRPNSGVVFTAESSLEDVRSFFDPNLGASFHFGNSEHSNVVQPSLCKYLKIDAKDFPQGRNKEDFVASREITSDGWVIVILMSYRVDDKRFTANVSKFPKDYTD